MNPSPPGAFVVVEGPNQAGKTRVILELSALLKGGGREVVTTREPGGTPMGEGLRSVLKDPAMKGGDFATALVFNGARKEHIDRVVTPSVQGGKVVLCDRYFMSTEVFQVLLSDSLAERERDTLRSIHATFPIPDLTVFILPDAEVLSARRSKCIGELDAFEGNADELAAYNRYAADFLKRHVGATLVVRPALQDEGKSYAGLILERLDARLRPERLSA